MTDLSEIKKRFDEYFSSWEIILPESDLINRTRGKIVQNGWAIWYLFGRNPKGEYLDFYCAHRMTNDRHHRFYADGKEEGLPALSDFYPVTGDAAADKAARLAYLAENQEISKMLAEKGFGMTGEEPGGVQMNTYLKTTDYDGKRDE